MKQAEFWDDLAASWEKWMDRTLHPRQGLHDEMISRAGIDPSSTVLDFATGIGEPGISAALRPAQMVFGCDVSAGMMAVAKKRAITLGASNYRTELLNSELLPFADSTFDAALCSFGLEFSEKPETAVKEILRVLKRGGTLCVSVWGPEELNPIQNIVLNDLRSLRPKLSPASGIWKYADPTTLRSVMITSGFQNVAHEPFRGQYEFKNFDELWQFKVETSAPLVETLRGFSKSELEELKALVRARCKPYQSRNAVVLPFSALIFSGDKVQ